MYLYIQTLPAACRALGNDFVHSIKVYHKITYIFM